MSPAVFLIHLLRGVGQDLLVKVEPKLVDFQIALSAYDDEGVGTRLHVEHFGVILRIFGYAATPPGGGLPHKRVSVADISDHSRADRVAVYVQEE